MSRAKAKSSPLCQPHHPLSRTLSNSTLASARNKALAARPTLPLRTLLSRFICPLRAARPSPTQSQQRKSPLARLPAATALTTSLPTRVRRSPRPTSSCLLLHPDKDTERHTSPAPAGLLQPDQLLRLPQPSPRVSSSKWSSGRRATRRPSGPGATAGTRVALSNLFPPFGFPASSRNCLLS